MTKEHETTTEIVTQIADREQSAHLSAKVQPVQAEFLLSADSLPFEKLGGPGFERLCYLLLLTHGHSPLYFGVSGQAQRGIDLLVEEDGEHTVYQCKNVRNFSTPDMIAALEKFELEWLQTDLPKPKRFVLCLTRSLRDVKDLEPWEKYREEFSKKHQVEVGTPWDRNYLNEKLKQLPDIVAEIFSDQIAELFCERDEWDFDQFHPLAVNATEPSLKRYFARKTTDRLYLDPELIAKFTEKLERNGSVLIKGLPGSGKTITSLALTEELNRYRVYYLSLRDAITNDLLVKGIKDRLSRRTIFLLDDCQGKFVQLDSLMIRIRRLLQGRPNQALFVFLTRTTPTPNDLARGDEITGFEEDLKQADAVLKFAPDQQTFRQIIEQGKPKLAHLTAERLANLYEFTGHDLFLLDQLLDTLDDPKELDDLNLEFLFQKTVARYFGRGTVDRPGFMHLAALAQFDLAPRTAKFSYNLVAEDPRAVTELVAIAGHPPRYFFLHSSAAELIFRALAWNDGIADHIGKAAEHLNAFFKGRASDDPTLMDDLSKAIRNRLKLVGGETEEERLKSTFLADDAIYELIERNFAMLPLNLLAVCRIILMGTNSTVLERYEELIRRKVEDGTVLQLAATRPFWDSGLFLRLTKRHYPQLLNSLRNQLAATGLRSLAQTTELQNFLAIFSLVAEPGDVDCLELLNNIPEIEVEAMMERTIAVGHTIGTLGLAMRELRENNEELLRRVEEKISAPRWLRLIAANGTIIELFKLMEYSTLALTEELVTALDDNLIEQLTARAIAVGRSIGTVGLVLRELKENDEKLLRRLEEKIGAPRWLHMISANGTIVEMFKLIEHSTLTDELITAMDDKLVGQLIAQTIAAGRSIGTFGFTLRGLKENDEKLLRRVEEKISAPHWLHLIATNGTIVEFFKLIEYSTQALRKELITALEDNLVEQLIAQTITAGRSIATLNFTLRELKQNDEALLGQLEAQIGAPRFLRLIAANGTIFELFRLIQDSTLTLAEQLITALDDKLVEKLIAQTITVGRSIGNLHWTLRYLKRANSALLRKLEENIGIDRWWRLIYSFGSIAILAELLPAMDRPFQQKFIQAAKSLSAEEWKALLRQNGFYELCYLVKNFPWFFSANFRPDFLKPIIVTLIQSSNWEARNLGWVNLSNASDSVGKRYLLKLLNEQLRGTQPDTLDFLSFSETAHGVNLLWRLLPTRRNELADALRRFINTGKPIYSDPAYLRSIRLLFATLATPQARPTDARIVLSLGNDATVAKLCANARIVLSLGNDATVAKLCAKATTLDLFLYLWNLFALWFEWKSPQERSFADFLNAELAEALITGLTGRLRASKDKQEADILIMLAGSMSFLGISCDRSSAMEDFLLKLPSLDEMAFDLDHKRPFIPSVFFLLGLEWIFQEEGGVPAMVWREQLPKANDYPETTAALEHLKSLATDRSRLV